ncbi:exported hypothetical protein [Nitrolancea hollandica Lb]|uniref:Uncharacterized protein n=1 Tax=Nitrolancea hollandica Lb TaxID=1129897 RepID=I4EIU4_9BACT|nr:exported hypothetical protein [Nitrolancea hollandica Lb]
MRNDKAGRTSSHGSREKLVAALQLCITLISQPIAHSEIDTITDRETSVSQRPNDCLAGAFDARLG